MCVIVSNLTWINGTFFPTPKEIGVAKRVGTYTEAPFFFFVCECGSLLAM
jgi:hypothetical protein